MATRVLSPVPEVVDAVAAALAPGPLAVPQLEDRLQQQGIELGPEPDLRLFDVLDHGRFVLLEDERMVDVLALAEGVTVTHELGAGEVFTGKVDLEPDLVVLAGLEVAGLALSSSSGRLDCQLDRKRGTGVLVGPDGWLGPGAYDGATLVVTISGRQTSLSTTHDFPPIAPAPETVAAVRRAYERLAGSGPESAGPDGAPAPVSVFDLWVEALSADRDAFTATSQAPMTRLLGTAGLESHFDRVAPAGYDWNAWEVEQVFDQVAHRWGLGAAGREAFIAVARAFQASVDGHLKTTDLPLLGQLLSSGTVAPAFVGEALGNDADSDGSVAAFARAAEEAASSRDRAGPLWVQAICAERAGRTLDAESLVAAATTANGDYPPALHDAAWYAADRGDTRRAASLLRRAGDEADEQTLEMLELFSQAPEASVGRNDPCPCGSGKKYKFCHLGREALPLSERALLLHHKGMAYLERGRYVEHQVGIAIALAGGGEDRRALGEALQSALVTDLVLFEDHAWDDFVRDRGILLPPDELALAQEWQQVQRSVHEVMGVRLGEGITVKNLRSGAVVFVNERGGAERLKVLDLLCARIVPVGNGQHRVMGGFEVVDRRDRDELVALLDTRPTGASVAAWFGMIADRRRHEE
ncbi:MAG: SEC-C metal-binding domain-containing protein [Acidimicrobiales bacterium]